VHGWTSPFFRKYLLPGLVFQSVVIAGGYGTGREIIEYFLNFGPLGGLLGMVCVTTVLWSVILAVTFEFARTFRAYDYRTYFRLLLGRFWFVFEAFYLFAMLLVLAVVGSAAGVMLRDNFGMPYAAGVLIMLLGIGFLTFKGAAIIEQFLAGWSIVLYVSYALVFIAAVMKYGSSISAAVAGGDIRPGFVLGGFKYALYNFNIIAAVLFCLHHLETRREAVTAGILGGVIGILPAILFFIAVSSHYPDVLAEEIPMVYLLSKIGSPLLLTLIQIVIFGTLIETGTGLIHAVNERIHSVYRERGKELPRIMRPLTAALLILISLGLSRFGLINLIAKGYGASSWGFLVIFVIPLFTIGIYKIAAHSNKA